MNKILSFWLLLLALVGFPYVAYSQVVVIESANYIYLHPGGNFIKVAVEGYSAKSIFITTDNGTIEGSNGGYSISPKEARRTTIFVYLKTANGSKIIGKSYLHVKRLPATTWFANYSEEHSSSYDAWRRIAPYDAWRQIAPGIRQEYACGKYAVDSFKVVVVRNGKRIFKKMEQDRLSHTSKNFFRTLRSGDKLLILDVAFTDYDKVVRNAPSLAFTIEGSGKDIPPDPEEPEFLEDPLTGDTIKNPRWKP